MNEQRITSRQNERVKRAVRLRTRRGREQLGRFLIDGARELGQAITAGVEIEELFVCEPLCRTDASREAADGLRATETDVLEVTRDVFSKVAYGSRAEGVMAVARTPRRALSDLQLPEAPLVALVEGVEKPGNLGAILRSADAAGVSAVVAVEGGTDLFNPSVVRASLGTLFRLPVRDATVDQAIAWCRAAGIAVVAARPNAKRLYTEVDYRGPTAVLLGSEAHGLSSAWRDAAPTAIRLPQEGIGDSLNVSVAAAVIFYEALRQRTAGGRIRSRQR